MAQQPQNPNSPFSPYIPGTNTLYTQDPAPNLVEQSLGDRLAGSILAPEFAPTQKPLSWLDEIGGDSQKAREYLYKDPRVKEDITYVAKRFHNEDLSGKTNEEVADWLLNWQRTTGGSVVLTGLEALNTAGAKPEDAERYARVKGLFEALPNFEGGVGSTLWDYGKSAVVEAAASAGVGTAIKGAQVLGKGSQWVAKNILIGSAGTDAAKLAAQKAAASGASKRAAAGAAAWAGALKETIPGAVWAGSQNIGEQAIKQNVGMQDEFSLGELGLNAAGGAVLGGALGAGLHSIGGAHTFSKFAPKFEEIASRNIPDFQPSVTLTMYQKELDHQKSVIESEIAELRNSADPADQMQVQQLLTELADIEQQRTAIVAANNYSLDRQAKMSELGSISDPNVMDNTVAAINDLDLTYSKVLTANDPDDLHAALAKFASAKAIQFSPQQIMGSIPESAAPAAQTQPPARAADTGSNVDQITTGEAAPATPETPAAPTEQAAPAEPAAPVTGESAANAVEQVGEKIQGAAEAVVEEIQKTEQAAKRKTRKQAIEDRADELLKEAGVAPQQPAAAPDATPAETPKRSGSTKAQTENAEASHEIDSTPLTFDSKRPNKATIVDAVVQRTGKEETRQLFDSYLGSLQAANGKRLTVKQMVAAANEYIATQKMATSLQPIIDRVQSVGRMILADAYDNNTAVSTDDVMAAVMRLINKSTEDLPVDAKNFIIQQVRDYVEATRKLTDINITEEVLADIDAGLGISADDLTKLVADNNVEQIPGSGSKGRKRKADKITYDLDSLMSDLPRRPDVERRVMEVARDLALQIERTNKANGLNLNETQKRNALRKLVLAKMQKELSVIPAHDKQAMNQSAIPAIEQDGELVSGRNQSKDVLGRTQLGDTQRVLKEATGGAKYTEYTYENRGGEGYAPRVPRYDGGEYVGAVEAARRAIWRAATANANRIGPEAMLRELNGFSVGRAEGNTSQFFIQLPGGERTPIPAKVARDLELFRAVENYVNKYAPPPVGGKAQTHVDYFKAVLKTVEQRYGRTVTNDELKPLLQLVLDGESLLTPPKAKPKQSDKIEFEGILPPSRDEIEDIEQAALQARGLAISKAVLAFKRGELSEAQLNAQLDDIYDLSDDDILTAAYNKIAEASKSRDELSAEITRHEMARSGQTKLFEPTADETVRTVTLNDLDRARGDFYKPHASAVVLLDDKGAIRIISDTKTIREQYGEDALGWQIGVVPFKSLSNRAIAKIKFKNLADIDVEPKPLAFDKLDTVALTEADIDSLGSMASAVLNNVADGQPITLKTVMDAVTGAESAPWPNTLEELRAFTEAYTQLVNILKAKAPNGIQLTRVYRDTAKAELTAIFADASPTEIALVNKMIDNLGGDTKWAPMVKIGPEGSEYIPPIGADEITDTGITIRNNAIYLSQNSPARAYDFSHELAHWAFRNILSFDDRIKFFNLMENYYKRDGSLDYDMLDSMLPEVVANRFDSPQELFANQFTQWLFSEEGNGFFGSAKQYKESVMGSLFRAIGEKFKAAINKLAFGKRLSDPDEVGVLDDDLFQFFNQIITDDVARPSRAIDRSTLKNPKSQYFANIGQRIDERVTALEYAIQSFNPVTLHEANKDALMFLRWLLKNSRKVSLYSKGTHSFRKVANDEQIIETIRAYARQSESFEELSNYRPVDHDEIDMLADDGNFTSDFLDEIEGDFEPRSFEYEPVDADIYTANKELVGQQQLAALRLQEALDFAFKQVRQNIRRLEKQPGGLSTLSNDGLDEFMQLADELAEAHASVPMPKAPEKTDPRTSDKLRDALKLAVERGDEQEIKHLADNLEWRGAPKLNFPEELVYDSLLRRMADDGYIEYDYKLSPTESSLLSAINYRNTRELKGVRTVALRLMMYNGLHRKENITNADLARIAGIESDNTDIATTNSPEFKAFRTYVKKVWEARNRMTSAPNPAEGNLATPEFTRASSFTDNKVASDFGGMLTGMPRAGKVLDFIIENSEHINPVYTHLAKRLKNFGTVGNRIHIVDSETMMTILKNKSKGGKQYDSVPSGLYTGNRIYLLEGMSGGDTMSVLMHEMIHAATLNHISKDSRSYKKMQTFFDEVSVLAKDQGFDTENWYGFTNVDEFMAEAFTNGEFQTLLSKIDYTEPNSNVLKQFVKFIMELLGFDGKYNNALTNALVLGDNVLKENRRNMREMERMLSLEQEYFAMHGFSDAPQVRAYDLPSEPKRILNRNTIPPSLAGAFEQEVGSPVLFNSGYSKNGQLVTLKPKVSIPNNAIGNEVKRLDAEMQSDYLLLNSAEDPEVRAVIERRIQRKLAERDILAQRLRRDGIVTEVTPVTADVKSIFRLDNDFQYDKNEVMWLARAVNERKAHQLAASANPVVTGKELRALLGEDGIIKVLRDKGVSAVTLGADGNELTMLSGTATAAKPKAKVRDSIKWSTGAENTPQIAGILAVTGRPSAGTFPAVAQLAQQQGATTEIVDAMRRMAAGREATPQDRGAISKGFTRIFAENSQRLRSSGMNYVADFLKPENGVGLYERHSSELAKKVMGIYELADKLPDAKNPIKRWAHKLHPFNRSVQPQSHKRIVMALRRGDPSGLQSREEREVFEKAQRAFRNELDEMRAEGIQVGDVTIGRGVNGYFPQVWDADKISEDPNKFVNAMSTWFIDQARREGDFLDTATANDRAIRLMKRLTDEESQGVLHHAFGYSDVIGDSFMNRVLRLTTDDLNRLGLESFMVNDLEGVIAKYFDATTRRRLFHKEFGLRNHGIEAYKSIIEQGQSAVRSLLNGEATMTKSYGVGNMPDNSVARMEERITFIPAAIKDPAMASDEASRFYKIANTKDRTVAIPEIEAAILGHYEKYASSGFYPEMQKRARAMANAIVDSVSASREPDEVAFIEKAMNSAQNKMITPANASRALMKFSRGVRTFSSVTLLPFTVLTSFSDLALPLLRSGNMKAWMKGVHDYATVPEYRESVRRMGATINTILHDRLAHVYGQDSSQIGNAFFNLTLLTPWTKMMREMATVVGFEALRADAELAQRLIAEGKMNTRAYRLAKRRLDYYGLGEYGKAVNPKKFGELTDAEGEDAIRYALMKFANETIFEPNNNDVPIWAQTPIGKIVYQLKSFPHMMSRTLARSASQNEIEKFALAYLAVVPAFGAATLSIKDIVQARGGEDEKSHALRDRKLSNAFGQLELNEDTDRLLGWYAESLLVAAGLGLLGDMLYNAAEQADNGAYGQMRMVSTILGPSVGLISEGMDVVGGVSSLITGEEATSRRRQAMRTIAGDVPVLGGIRSFREAAADLAGEPGKGGRKAKQTFDDPFGIGGFDIQGFDINGIDIEGL
jgi:hypothetical protein